MDTRKAIDAPAIGYMAILCFAWALQQIAIKAAAPDIAPILQVALRSGIAAVLVALLMRSRNEPFNLGDERWRPGLVVGLLFATEFLFLGEGLRYTTASHMAVFVYTAPFFAAIGLHWMLPEEKLAGIQWVGIGIAFLGVAAVFLGSDNQTATDDASNILLGDFYGLLAGAAWGATTVVIRCTSLSNATATSTLLYQLICAFILLLAASFISGQTSVNPTKIAISSVLFQGVIVSFLAFLAWFWLLRKYLASRLGVFTFMTPLFGIILGSWLLDEPLDTNFLVGAACVSVGIVLVSGRDFLQQALQKVGTAE